jgi:hypothetical protein
MDGANPAIRVSGICAAVDVPTGRNWSSENETGTIDGRGTCGGDPGVQVGRKAAETLRWLYETDVRIISITL